MQDEASSTRVVIERATRSRRWALAIMLGGLAGAAALLAWILARPPPPAGHIEAGEELDAWATGYRVVPVADLPGPVTKLEGRLRGLGRAVERARLGIDPPLAAFGAEPLREEIERALAGVADRAEVSVHVRDLQSSRILFDFAGDTPLNPASNNKLITSAAALDLLGPDYVFETRVLLAGDALWIIGEGDPTLDPEGIRTLAREVAERVAIGDIGRIVVDDSAFSPDRFAPGFDPDQTDEAYLAPSGALSLAFNSVEIHVSRAGISLEPPSTHVEVVDRTRPGSGRPTITSLPHEGGRTSTRIVVEGRVGRGLTLRKRIYDPGAFTGGAFALALAEATQSEALPVEFGVAPEVDASTGDEDEGLPRMVGRSAGGADLRLIALRRSAPLIEIVGGVLAWSNNVVAEQLARTLAWRLTGRPGDWAGAREVVTGYWATLGNDPGGLVYENGSGLSRRGRVTTRGLVELLAIASRTQARGSGLIDALPVAGASPGTLGSRLRRSGRRVRAKTGTLDGVSALSGVITDELGEPQVAFSIIINVRESGRMYAESRRALEDAIVMDVLRHIDDWEAVRAALVLDLEPLEVRAAD